MKKLILSLGFLSLSMFGLFVRCSDETEVGPKYSTHNQDVGIASKTIIGWKPASTEEEFFRLIRDPRVNMIRSTDDFIERTKQQGTVYAKLDKEIVKAFVMDLKFKNRGLSTARYSIIKASLSEEDYYEFWRGFGIGSLFLTDHYEYQCESVGNCKEADEYICTSNC